MALLAVHDPTACLAYRSGAYAIQRGQKEIRRVRSHEIDEIHLFGPVTLTPGARAAALARNVPVVFLTRDGRYRGRLSPREGLHARRLLAQVRWLSDPDHRLSLARSVVDGKLHNQRQFLIRVQQRRADDRIAAAAAALRRLRRDTSVAGDLATLRGLEGAGAATYFGVWDAVIRHPNIAWTRRTRRPPRDATNACLSFGYTLLASRVRDAVLKAGLLPSLGALHETSRNQDALVFDLVEELRTIAVDTVVTRLINRGQLDVQDFEDPRYRNPVFSGADEEADPSASTDKSVVYLAASGRGVILPALARRWRDRIQDPHDPCARRTLSDLLDRQVWQIAHLFEDRADRYRPLPHP